MLEWSALYWIGGVLLFLFWTVQCHRHQEGWLGTLRDARERLRKEPNPDAEDSTEKGPPDNTPHSGPNSDGKVPPQTSDPASVKRRLSWGILGLISGLIGVPILFFNTFFLALSFEVAFHTSGGVLFTLYLLSWERDITAVDLFAVVVALAQCAAGAVMIHGLLVKAGPGRKKNETQVLVKMAQWAGYLAGLLILLEALISGLRAGILAEEGVFMSFLNWDISQRTMEALIMGVLGGTIAAVEVLVNGLALEFFVVPCLVGVVSLFHRGGAWMGRSLDWLGRATGGRLRRLRAPRFSWRDFWLAGVYGGVWSSAQIGGLLDTVDGFVFPQFLGGIIRWFNEDSPDPRVRVKRDSPS